MLASKIAGQHLNPVAEYSSAVMSPCPHDGSYPRWVIDPRGSCHQKTELGLIAALGVDRFR